MTRFIRALGAILGLLLLADVADLGWLTYVRATITTTASSTTALGNGSTTNFTFNFVAGQASYITVTYTDSSGNSTVLTSSQYTLALNPPSPGQVWGIGGTVTYPTVASGNPPISAGTTLTIARNVPLIQAVSSNGGQLFPLAVEQALDLLDMQIQQVSAVFSRALVQPITDTQALSPLPGAAARANLGLCFDSTGYVPIACSTPASGIISSAMQPVVSAGSLASGRTAFGLGTAAVLNANYGLQQNVSALGNLDVNFPTQQIANDQNITAASHLNLYAATGPLTLTLPRSNTLWNGFGFWVHVISGGSVTLAIDSNDTFEGQSSGVSLALPVGAWSYITTDGATFGTWRASLSLNATSNGGRAAVLNRTLLFTTSATYTPASNIAYDKAICVGGGGGGGGAQSTGSTNVSGGGGGGAGATVTSTVDATLLTAPIGVTIGGGGTSSAGGAGTNGSPSSFGSVFTAGGGTGGSVANGAGFIASGGAGGVPSGTYLIGVNGAAGSSAFGIAPTPLSVSMGGIGGGGYLGGGASPPSSQGFQPSDATSWGAGGTGASNPLSHSPIAGSTGFQGFCLVEEYVWQGTP